MGNFFGTDGIRGVVLDEISPEIVYSVGNSLARLSKNKTIIVGKDTRLSADFFSSLFISGLLGGGVNVLDVGVVTTPALAFLTRFGKFDFGVEITASHNPAEFNGIKIFDSSGHKINENMENEIERNLFKKQYTPFEKLGQYTSRSEMLKKYKKKIIDEFEPFKKLKVVLDCANGAAINVAKDVFSALGATVIMMNNEKDGKNINNNCGAIFPQNMQAKVLECEADVGFSFDGDADRIVCSNEMGKLLDGDDILFILGKYSNEKYKKIVGTTLSNKGLENELKKNGTLFVRADVGDKYVSEKMAEVGAEIGGEPAGHIIISKYATTGDGVLTALAISNILVKQNKKLSELSSFYKFPQTSINVSVKDKFRAINSNLLAEKILKTKADFNEDGRIIVRASGTENKIRIMCEHKNKFIAEKIAREFEQIIKLENK